METQGTSIKRLSYLLLDMVNGGLPSDDSKINYRVAREHIRNAVAYQLRLRFFEEKNNSDSNYVGIPTSKEVEVKYDEDMGSYYVETLGESIDLGGARSISISNLNRNSRWAMKFTGITLNEAFAQRGLTSLPNTIQYYLDGDKIYFMNGDVSDLPKVRLTQYNLLPKDDDSEIPSDIGGRALSEAFRIAMGEIQIPSDRSNDGVPNN